MYKQFHFNQLDTRTRIFMKAEFERDSEKGIYYKSPRLTDEGFQQFPILLERSISSANDISLSTDLKPFIKEYETRIIKGIHHNVKVPHNAPLVLGQGQFNFYYMRGICARAISEGLDEVEIYRARQSYNSRRTSQWLIGKRINAAEFLNEMRVTKDPGSTSLQIGLPNSGLSVRF